MANLHIGVDIHKPFDGQIEESARRHLSFEWGRRNGGTYEEIITDTDNSRSIEWKSLEDVNG